MSNLNYMTTIVGNFFEACNSSIACSIAHWGEGVKNTSIL